MSDPGSDRHLRFRSAREIRRRYGATPATVRRARSRLGELGIRDLQLDRSGAALVGQVTASTARSALGVELVRERRADGSEVVEPAMDPTVPKRLRGPIVEVVGLTATLLPPAGDLVGPVDAGARPDPGCEDVDLASDRSVADYLRYFGTGSLYDAGHDGTGASIAIWSQDQFDPVPVRAFARCRETPVVLPSVSVVPGAPEAAPGAEVTLDVIMAGWTAPGASLRVIRLDPFASPVFALAESLDVAGDGRGLDLLSTSIGFCETALPGPELDLADDLLAALAAEGVTTLAASGDHGVAGCYPDRTPGPSFPASSPHATAVGGTEFVLADGSIRGERAWREPDGSAAGGGGTSEHFARPSDQAPIAVSGRQRAYPDVAAFAAVNRLGAVPSCGPTACTWMPIGGTSASAPTLAANLALALSASRAAGGPDRLGLLRPLVAQLAERRSAALVDVTRGSTALFGNDCCRATPGYDLATGWGSLTRFDRLASWLERHDPST